jgi:hypothetical protein
MSSGGDAGGKKEAVCVLWEHCLDDNGVAYTGDEVTDVSRPDEGRQGSAVGDVTYVVGLPPFTFTGGEGCLVGSGIGLETTGDGRIGGGWAGCVRNLRRFGLGEPFEEGFP